MTEYDHYDYGSNLNSENNLAPNINIATGERDHLTQDVAITANAVRIGLNFKFMDTYFTVPSLMVINPWMVYIGLFGGYSTADFAYGANYFATIAALLGGNQVFKSHVFQQGFSTGGQIGVNYHFCRPYFLGLVLSAQYNANQARLVEHVEDGVVTDLQTFDINHAFRLKKNLDIAALIGADITARTHIYAKVGSSYAQFTHKLFTTRARNFPFPIPVLQQTAHKDLWGLVLGLGITQDINRWVSLFAEYDHYNYENRNLNALDNIRPNILSTTHRDHLTQHVELTAHSIYAGLNFRFMDNFRPAAYELTAIDPWIIYMGLFGGYYSADFSYGANYVVDSPQYNQSYNNDTFQSAYSWGGQAGVQYYCRSLFYGGIEFIAMSNLNKAKLTEHVDDTNVFSIDMNHQFRINHNLDFTGVFGVDITLSMRFYVKAGGSYAQYTHKFFTTFSRRPLPTTIFEQDQHESIWGFVFGLGLTRDFGKWISAFAEYDHYDYGNRKLNNYDQITGPLNLQNDRITQHATMTANTIRVGLNVKFAF